MPQDDEDEYEDDGGNEMVDMEDDEAQPENDQLQNNKMTGQDTNNAYDENRLPSANEKHFTAQVVDPSAGTVSHQKPLEENAYVQNNGVVGGDLHDQNSGGFQAKQIQNNMVNN